MKCKANSIVIFLLLGLFSFSKVWAQKKLHYSVSLFNNAIAMPFSGKAGIVHSPMHPGGQVGLGWLWREKEKSEYGQSVYAGYAYQRLVHHIGLAYSEGQGSWKIYKGLWAGTALGLGAAHIVNTAENPIFKMNNEGEYVRTKRWGQTKIIGSFALQAGYKINTERHRFQPFIRYQFWMLAPFVKSYVPLLPNAALHVGCVVKPNWNKQ